MASWLETDPDRLALLRLILDGHSVWKAAHLLHKSGKASRRSESTLYRIAQQVDAEIHAWFDKSVEDWLEELRQSGQLLDPPPGVCLRLREMASRGEVVLTEHTLVKAEFRQPEGRPFIRIQPEDG